MNIDNRNRIEKFIYICAGNPSVFEAQVLELLDYYTNNQFFKEIILLQGYKNRKERKEIESKTKLYQIKIVWFRYYPHYFLLSFLTIISLNHAVLKVTSDNKYYFIHIRDDMFGYFIKMIFKIRKLPFNFLIDIRGLIIEELKYKKILSYASLVRYKLKYAFITHEYKQILRKPYSELTVVSPMMKKILLEEYNYPDEYISIHSNIAGIKFKYNFDQRLKIRAGLSINEVDYLAICSTGGGAAWQKDYQLVSELINKGIKVLNLSPKVLEIPGVINKYVTFSDMPNYLSAADIAILWRDPIRMNEVASPSKFSEFAVMGLYVIHNGSVSIANDYIEKTGAGCIITCASEISIERFSIINDFARRKWIQAGQDMFGIERIAKSYIRTYKKTLRHAKLN